MIRERRTVVEGTPPPLIQWGGVFAGTLSALRRVGSFRCCGWAWPMARTGTCSTSTWTGGSVPRPSLPCCSPASWRALRQPPEASLPG